MKVGAFVVLTVAAFAVTTGHAAAQGNALALALCRKVPDDQARLKCYDAALDAFFGETKEKANDTLPEPGLWQIEDQKSPVDDSQEVTAALKTTSGEALLVARCKEKKTELLFMPGSFAIFPTSSGGIKVVLRINDAPAVTESWSSSTNGRVVFSQTPVETLKVLPDNGRLFVRAFDFQGAGKDASFDLGTASEVREKIRVTCRWPAPKPAAKASSPVAGSAPGKP